MPGIFSSTRRALFLLRGVGVTAQRTYIIRCDGCGFGYVDAGGPARAPMELATAIRAHLKDGDWRHVIIHRPSGPSKSLDFCAHCCASGKGEARVAAEGGQW